MDPAPGLAGGLAVGPGTGAEVIPLLAVLPWSLGVPDELQPAMARTAADIVAAAAVRQGRSVRNAVTLRGPARRNTADRMSERPGQSARASSQVPTRDSHPRAMTRSQTPGSGSAGAGDAVGVPAAGTADALDPHIRLQAR